jgi:hypothetical protein
MPRVRSSPTRRAARHEVLAKPAPFHRRARRQGTFADPRRPVIARLVAVARPPLSRRFGALLSSSRFQNSTKGALAAPWGGSRFRRFHLSDARKAAIVAAGRLRSRRAQGSRGRAERRDAAGARRARAWRRCGARRLPILLAAASGSRTNASRAALSPGTAAQRGGRQRQRAELSPVIAFSDRTAAVTQGDASPSPCPTGDIAIARPRPCPNRPRHWLAALCHRRRALLAGQAHSARSSSRAA